MSQDNLNLNISGTGAPLQNVDGVPVAANVSGAGVTAALASSIAPSQASQVEDSINAAIPVLAPPHWDVVVDYVQTAAVTKALMAADESMNKACIAMLDKWNEDLKARADEMRAKATDPNEVRKTEERLALSLGVENYIKSADPASDVFIPVITLGIVFSATSGAREAMLFDTQSTRLGGVNPTANDPQTQQYQDNTLPQINLMAMALVQGISTLASTLSVNKADDPQLSAKNYAELIAGLIISGELTKLAAAIVTTNASKSEAADKKAIGTLTVQLKLTLILSALAALYKTGTGGMKHEELAGLLNGSNKTFGPNAELMQKLIDAFNAEKMNLDPALRQAFLSSLFAFIDSDPNVSVLTNPAKVFASLNSQFGPEEQPI